MFERKSNFCSFAVHSGSIEASAEEQSSFNWERERECPENHKHKPTTTQGDTLSTGHLSIKFEGAKFRCIFFSDSPACLLSYNTLPKLSFWEWKVLCGKGGPRKSLIPPLPLRLRIQSGRKEEERKSGNKTNFSTSAGRRRSHWSRGERRGSAR